MIPGSRTKPTVGGVKTGNKRFGGGHGHAPAQRITLPPDGIDPLPPQEEWKDIWGQKPLEDYPTNDGLERLVWKSYQEAPLPPLFPSAEENLRLWQEIHIERQIDNHPPHEIHCKDLPDYHYWPMIQNDVENKFTGQVSTLVQFQYHHDQHQIPRFHKNGVPKTPPQEQMWYVPLDSNGRCDWRAVMAKWSVTNSPFDKTGWDRRYLRWAWQDELVQWRSSMKAINLHKPAHFTHRQLNWSYRYFRQKRGSLIAWPLHFLAMYTMIIGGTAAANATYSDLNWHDDPWNYDIHYMKYFRDNGTLHPQV